VQEYQPAAEDARYLFLRSDGPEPILPPADDFGRYAAAAMEMVRSLLDPQQGPTRAVRDGAADLLARWDDGEPWDLHQGALCITVGTGGRSVS
jgi:hypothetical protein